MRIRHRKNENTGNGKKMCVNQPYLSEKNDIWLVYAQKINNSWTGMLEYRSHSHGHTTKGIAPGEYEWTAQNYVKLDDLFEL